MKINNFLRKSYNFVSNPSHYFQSLKFYKCKSELIHKVSPYTWLDDKFWLEYYFYKYFGRKLDLTTPKTFNERIQWMKLYDRNPIYINLSDKYLVREYVAEKIGSSYLNELVGIYRTPEEINWSSIPNKFALKANHGSGWNIICEDKENIDSDKAEVKLRDWMHQNFYKRFREWQYKRINPKIIIEKYIENSTKYGLIDYKVYCNQGKPRIIQIDVCRFTHHKRAFFDINWNRLNFTYKYPNLKESVVKPKLLDEMLEKASQLSGPLKFCRVDFYIDCEKLIFGEITFTPEAGFAHFTPQEVDTNLGQLLNFSQKL